MQYYVTAQAQNISKDEILARLRVIIAGRLGLVPSAETLGEEVGLLGQGIGLDSIEILQLVTAVEEEFSLILEDDEIKLEYFKELGSLVTFIQGKLAA